MTKRRRKLLPSLWLDTLSQSRSARKQRKISEQSLDPTLHEQTETRGAQSSGVVQTSLPPLAEQVCNEIEQERNPDELELAQDINNDTMMIPDLEDPRDMTSDFQDDRVIEEYDSDPEFQPFDETEEDLLDLRSYNESEDNGGNEQEVPNIVLSDDVESIDPLANHSKLHEMLQIWKNSMALSALVAVVGSVRYTVLQYEYCRNLLSDAGAANLWPPYSRTQRYFQTIIHACFPKSDLVSLEPISSITLPLVSDETERDATEENGSSPYLYSAHVSNNGSIFPTRSEKVRIFLPSSWAKHDVATSVVFDQMYPAYDTSQNNKNEIEQSDIVRCKHVTVSSCDRVFAISGSQRVPCGTGHVIRVAVQNLPPHFDTPFSLSVMNNSYFFNAIIAATWCVSEERSINASAMRAMNIGSLSRSQRILIQLLASAPSTDSEDASNKPDLIMGDLCTLLRSEQEGTNIFAIIVHRFCKTEDGTPSVTLKWVSLRLSNVGLYKTHPNTSGIEGNLNEENRVSSLKMLDSHIMRRLEHIRSPIENEDSSSHDGYRSSRRSNQCHGTLQDGTEFVTYRILLYCDDFQMSSAMQPKGAAGGCYFLPLSLPPEVRRSTSSVRIISLTPPGVSTNQVLHYIVDDLVAASIRGVNGHTPMGRKVKIFIDVVGFIGDYPASSSVVDVIGHIGRAPCTVCSFRRLKQRGREGSKFGYTTQVHANNSAFMRHGERHTSLRKGGLTDFDANKLGMVAGSKYSDVTCPLLYLQRALEEEESRSAYMESDGMTVLSRFDAFRCNMIAPDHLLTGLAKDILNATFKALPSEELRSTLDVYICDALRENGLLPQKEIFSKTKKTMHSMTLSETFCVLLVSVPTLEVLIKPGRSHQVVDQCFSTLE